MVARDIRTSMTFAPASECTVKNIGIIGHGKFGKHLDEDLLVRYAPHVSVRIFSRGKTGGRFVSFDEVAACDVIFLTVPIHAIEDTLFRLLENKQLRPDAIIVDVASVKQHTVEIFHRLAQGRRYLLTHPMFGPESFKKRNGNIAGFRIVVADHTLPKNVYLELQRFLTECGFNVIEVEAAVHDKHLAGTLFLAHYAGQIVYRAGFNRTLLDTVSFESLMNAVESVANDTELFEDVYRYIPKECDEVIARFKTAQDGVDARLKDIKSV